jgi:hypothetical protein
MTTEVRYVGLPSPIVKAALADLVSWHVVGERMLTLSKTLCPVSKSPQPSGWTNTASSGSLRKSLKSRYEYGLDPRIMIGSALTRGESRVSALGLIEFGTEAHPIDPKTSGGVLRFFSGGQIVFAAHVDHPGTKQNKFVERAMRTIILESIL